MDIYHIFLKIHSWYFLSSSSCPITVPKGRVIQHGSTLFYVFTSFKKTSSRELNLFWCFPHSEFPWVQLWICSKFYYSFHFRRKKGNWSTKRSSTHLRPLLKQYQSKWLKQQHLFLTVLETAKFKINVQADLVSSERPLTGLSAVRVLSHGATEQWGSMGGPFYKGINLIH